MDEPRPRRALHQPARDAGVQAPHPGELAVASRQQPWPNAPADFRSDPKETGLALTGYGCNDLTGSAMTHWSFGQLCSLASPGNSPASYFREARIPAPMIADCLNYNLRFTRGIEDVGVLVTRDGHASELRSVNGPNYGRVYDADVDLADVGG